MDGWERALLHTNNHVKQSVMYPIELVEMAKKERSIYEYRYRQAPALVAELLADKFKNKHILLFPNTPHSNSVYEKLGSHKDIKSCMADDNLETVCQSVDVVALIGYWNEEGVNDFCQKFHIDKSKIFLPYKSEELINSCNSTNLEIDKIIFFDKKPELVLIISHECRDFISQSARHLSKHFRLTKIYLQGEEESELNDYFEQTLALNGDIKALEYFFLKYAKLLTACAVFAHGIDFWKVPYISTLLCKDTKLITLTCDWFASILPIKDASFVMGKPVSYMSMEKEAEMFAMCHSNAVVTNFREQMLEAICPNSNIFTSYGFMDCNKFVFKTNKKNNITKYCFAGSLVPYDSHDGFKDNLNLSEVFKKITSQNSTIDVFEAYGRDLSKSQYSNLILQNRLSVKKTVSHELLPQVLSEYDYGLLVYNLPETLMRACFDIIGNLYQAKFITYISAGIPVVISAEFKAMSEIVECFGCGIVVANKDVHLIPQMVAEANYDAMKKGVKSFQNHYKENSPSEQLTNFLLETILAN